MTFVRLYVVVLFLTTVLFATPVENLKGSLSVNQGVLNYSVDLKLPKGVADVAPKLSLNYSSNAGNGYLGQGWSIGGLSSISRCGSSLTTDGRNRPVRLDDKDNFCIDGQRLIAIGENEYRTQIESYSKIVRSGDKKNPKSFKVWRKSGDIYEYTQVDVVANKNMVWMLSKISDRYGNKIIFNYNKEKNSTPKISSISYANNRVEFIYDSRRDIFLGYRKGKSLLVNKKLKRINIKIDNQDYKNYNLTYNSQSDAFDKLKLQSIKECIGSECTKPLTFEWQKNSEKVSFEEEGYFPSANVKEGQAKLVDLNGDGFTDIYQVKSGADNIWINDGTGHFNLSFHPDIRANQEDIKFVDIDGDGDIDIYEVDGGDDNIWLNNGKGEFSQSSHHPDIRANYDKILFVDIDQDMKVDIYVMGRNSDTIWMNSGFGTFYQKKTVINPKYTIQNYLPHALKPNVKKIDDISFTDMNDDGFLDIVGTLTYSELDPSLSMKKYVGSFVYINDGNEHFTPKVTVSQEPSSGWYALNNNYSYINMDLNGDGITDRLALTNRYINDTFTPPSKLYLANGKGSWNSPLDLRIYAKKEDLKFIDINGDGNIDIYQIKSGADDIWLNDGTGDFHKSSHHPDIRANAKDIKFADLNADGFVDIYEVDGGTDNLWLNDGDGHFIEDSLHPDVRIKTELIALADMNGDGLVDIVTLKNGASIYTNQMKRPVITAFTDSFSNKIDIEYSFLTNDEVYTKHPVKRRGHSAWCKPGATNCPFIYDEELTKINITNSSLVVSSVTIEDGAGGKNINSYKYEDLAYDFKRGILGFKKIIETNSKQNSSTQTEYYQDFPLTNRVKHVESRLNGEFISIEENTYKTDHTNGIYTVNLRSKLSSSYIDGEYIKSSNSYYDSYDNYGNILRMRTEIVSGNQNFTKTVTNRYNNNPSSWILGRLKESQVAHEGGFGGSITRKSSFTYNDKGSVISETIEPNNQLELTTHYEYDSFGNRVKKRISAPSLKEDRVTQYIYSSDGKNLLRTINPLGHTQKKDNQYNSFGQLTETTDANGLTTKIEYDAWGNKVKEIHADGTTTTYRYAFDNSVDGAKYRVSVKSTGTHESTTYYDRFDRKVMEKTQRFDGQEVYVEYVYNDKSELIKKSLPHTANEDTVYMTYSYDEYGRMVKTQKPGPNGTDIVERVEYSGLSATKVDAKGYTKTTTKNILEKIVKVEEADTVLKYTYDSIGNLVKTVPNGNEALAVKMSYDILGNKIEMQDPDMGHWRYSYDALGQLISQTDAKGETTTIKYDLLGRKIEEHSADGVSRWQYDTAEHGLGKLAYESNGKMSKRYQYDNYGRLSSVKTVIEDKSFIESYTYQADGKLATTTKPNGFKLINTYNAQGYLESIKSPAEQIKDFDRDHFAELLERTMANGLEYYKKSLEFSDKAKQLRSKADYYASIAKRYAKYEKIYHDYAKRLRRYAKRYEYYGKRYASYSARYRSYANYYYNRANYYYSRYRWWGRWIGSWFRRIGNRYSYYSRRYAYYSRYYLNRAKSYNYWADRYDYYGSYFGRVENYYLKKSKELYAEANALEVKAKEYKRLAANAGGGPNSKQVSQAYKEILGDADYVYHYKVLEQTSLGKVTKYLSGNGLVTEDVYDKTGVMKASKTGYTFDGGIRDLRYEYDKNFNVRKREDKKLNITQTFGYDELDRIAYSTVNSNTLGFESSIYTYDVYGNLLHKDGKDLEYGKGNHQVTSVEGETYGYDNNGNMLKSGRATLAYNAHNKVVDIRENGVHIHFEYDMNQHRYKKSEGLKDIYYIGKSYELQTHTNGSKTEKYMIYANGKVVTVHSKITEVQTTGEKFTTDETRYLHYDSLGSVDTITNQQGSVVQRTAYRPFGEKLEIKKLGKGKEVTNRGYTGHEHIEGTKFIHMNARLYDPTIGRFVSADTFIQDPYDSQSYNRYSYVKNNPLRYTDPTGHFFSGLRHWVSNNWRAIVTVVVVAIVVVATGGAASAGIAGLGWSPVAVGAAAGFAGGFTSTILNGGSIGQSLRAGVIGGVIGAVTAGFAQGIGDARAWMSSQAGNEFAGLATRTVLHGALSSFMSKVQGGKWSAGFYAGAVGTYLGSAIKTGNNYFANIAKNAIISGSVSRITGGKFANGAIMGAFRYMFNDALHKYKKILEIGNINLKDNIEAARKMSMLEFKNKVKTNGPWDYKNQKIFRDAVANGLIDSDLMQRFGNFHFGMVANANGFNLLNSMYGAGIYQVLFQGGGNWTEALTSTGYWVISLGGTFSQDILIAGKTRQGYTWGDNSGDSKDIMEGWQYCEKNF